MSSLRYPFLVCCLSLAVATGCHRPPVANSLPEKEKPSSLLTKKGVSSTEQSSDIYAPLSDDADSVTKALGFLNEITDANELASLADRRVANLSQAQLSLWIGSLSKLPPSEARDALLLSTLKRMAESDSIGALRLAITLDRASAEKIIRKIADVSVQTDFAEVFQFGTSLPPGPLHEKIQTAAIRYWSDRDPVAAFRFLADFDPRDAEKIIGIAAKRVALRNPAQAFEMLDLLNNPKVWERSASVVFGIYSEKNLPAATELFLDQTDPKVGIPFGYALGSTYAVQSVNKGIDILNKIQDPSVANHFIHGMLHRIGDQDMAPVLEQIPRIQNSEYREITADSAGRGVGKSNPTLAMSWVGTLTDEEARARAYQGVGYGLVENDPKIAEQWLQNLPPGKDRRYAIYGYATRNASKDPRASAYWALQIAETDVRERLLVRVLSSWNQKNAAQAQEWASQTGNSKLLLPSP